MFLPIVRFTAPAKVCPGSDTAVAVDVGAAGVSAAVVVAAVVAAVTAGGEVVAVVVAVEGCGAGAATVEDTAGGSPSFLGVPGLLMVQRSSQPRIQRNSY